MSVEPRRRWATVAYDKKTGATDVQWLPPAKVVGGFLPQRTTGELVPMSDAQWDRWGPEPAAWQPIGKWPDPLPDPLPAGEVRDEIRMGSIGKIRFDATQAAAEMEADREDARRNREPREAVNLAWWRDASRIRYQPPGEITREMAEGRIMRAVSWCGHGQGLTVGSQVTSQVLAKLGAMTLSEALAAQENLVDKVVRLDPLRQDHDDWLTAMGWFSRLGDLCTPGTQKAWSLNRPQSILLWRSYAVPLSFADIGRQINTNRQRAHQLYEQTIDRIVKIANWPAGIEPAILAVRERNRAARRAG
jgi:hypothetical protein